MNDNDIAAYAAGQKPLHFEPRQASPLEFYAALHAGESELPPDPIYGGQLAEIHATELASTNVLGGEEKPLSADIEAAERPSRKTSRPCPPARAHVALALLTFIGLCLALLGVLTEYADAFLAAVVRWVGGAR